MYVLYANAETLKYERVRFKNEKRLKLIAGRAEMEFVVFLTAHRNISCFHTYVMNLSYRF